MASMERRIQGDVVDMMLAAMNQGAVSIPYLLLRYYPNIKLTDSEAMLLIHIISYKEKEQKDFPTMDELQGRMSATPEFVANTLQKLLEQQFITIDEEIDPYSGIQSEKYNLQLTFRKLARCYINDLEAEASQIGAGFDTAVANDDIVPASTVDHNEHNTFTIFEQEFGRLLSPMEYETISGWIDNDQYNEELIMLALKEAVFAGKLHFRYIDRILIDWHRNRIRTAEQARVYTQQFRRG